MMRDVGEHKMARCAGAGTSDNTSAPRERTFRQRRAEPKGKRDIGITAMRSIIECMGNPHTHAHP